MKLFVFYIGGKTATSLIEVHDICFVISESLEACYETLRRQWWGTPQSLHIDCFAELTQADGYDITLSAQSSADKHKLYFLNLGGYNPAEFTELHRNVFIVAEDEKAAKVRALAQIQNWTSPHKDSVYEIDAVVCLNGKAAAAGLHLHLTPAQEEKPFAFTCGYFPIAE